MTEDVDRLLDILRPRWPQEWGQEAAVRQALNQLIDDARQGRPTSLPIVTSSPSKTIRWLSMAKSLRELREYVEDAKVWLEQSDVASISRDVTVPEYSGPLAPMLKELAPEAYLRWETPPGRGRHTLLRLGRMHGFLRSRPDLGRDRVPSLAALRLEFTSALGVGNWPRAEACIDEIDRWNLDHAPGTVQMRIRLLEAQGASEELFRFVCLNKAWNFGNPRRIAAAIVGVVDACAIQPVESRDGIQAAFDLFRQAWYPKLVQCISDARGEHGAARLRAYAAALDGDRRTVKALIPSLPEALKRFLIDQIPDQDEEASVPPRQVVDSNTLSYRAQLSPGVPGLEPGGPRDLSEARSYWADLHASVREGQVVRARELIGSLESRLLDDPKFLAAAPDTLLELLSDPAIESRPGSKLLLYEVLTALIDAFVVVPGFPRLAHLEIYLSLLDGLVAVNGSTASDADSQLVLGLVGAVTNLSADSCLRCEQIVRAWWQGRPILQRIDWLAAALDTLALLHEDSQRLVDLYADGLALAARKGVTFSPAKIRMWRAIGRSLELSAEDVEKFLGPLGSREAADNDPLADAGLVAIAIVSLREASAREAALQLEARTGATVAVVTSLVADAETRHALSADLILYVWAATSHATYRAFDKTRDKIEYVQGTGASSIVLAAERWVARSATNKKM